MTTSSGNLSQIRSADVSTYESQEEKERTTKLATSAAQSVWQGHANRWTDMFTCFTHQQMGETLFLFFETK